MLHSSATAKSWFATSHTPAFKPPGFFLALFLKFSASRADTIPMNNTLQQRLDQLDKALLYRDTEDPSVRPAYERLLDDVLAAPDESEDGERFGWEWQ